MKTLRTFWNSELSSSVESAFAAFKSSMLGESSVVASALTSAVVSSLPSQQPSRLRLFQLQSQTHPFLYDGQCCLFVIPFW